MTRQLPSGLVLRQCGVGWNVYERATGMCLGFCIEWGRNDWRVFNPDVAFLVRLGRGRTRTDALRAAWPDLTPPRKPMEPPDSATTRCAAPAPHLGEAQHSDGPENGAEEERR